MKTGLLLIVVGDQAKRIFDKTRPSIFAYADKINVDDVIVLTQIPENLPNVCWAKYTLYDFLHKEFDRMIHMDIDLIIRPDCPNLFEVVPENKMGLFNEGKYTPRSLMLYEMANKYGVLKDSNWDKFSYYNAGLIVVSKRHRFVFKPVKEYVPLKFGMDDQTWMNYRIFSEGVPVHELDYKLNRMSCMNHLLGVSRLDSYIVHYAGTTDKEGLLKVIDSDIKRWETDSPEYKYDPCIYVNIGGGIGDQACVEPALRYMSEKLMPNAEFWALTAYPRLFQHLKNVRVSDQTPEIIRDAIYTIDTHPTSNSAIKKYLSHFFIHGIDYASIRMMRRTIPDADKRLKLEVTQEDREEVRGFDPRIVIHPGVGWKINTFPDDWWKEVIETLSRKVKVAVVGKDLKDYHGAVSFDLPENCYDLRNKLSLGGLLAILEKTPLLLTNDSGPLHLAGAFDNYIAFVPTSKHPDHLLPWRHGKQFWKTFVFCKQLLEEKFPFTPNMLEWSTTVHDQEVDIKEFLPDSEVITRTILNLFKNDSFNSVLNHVFIPENKRQEMTHDYLI